MHKTSAIFGGEYFFGVALVLGLHLFLGDELQQIEGRDEGEKCITSY